MTDDETETVNISAETENCLWCTAGPILAVACFVVAGVFLLIGIDFLRAGKGGDD